jgi:hypothetical protein
MSYHRRPPSLPNMIEMRTLLRQAQWIAFGLLFAALLAAETVGLQRIYTSHNPGGNDLLPRWVATRAWLREGLNPYDPEIERRGQQMIYGRLATKPGEDLARFLYLPYAMLFVAPVALLPYDWAQAAWMTALQFCLVAMAIVSLHLYRWRPPAWLAALFIVWCTLCYPAARSLVLGQLTIVMALLIMLGLWAIRQRRDLLAGSLLALSTAKPTLAILLIPCIFLWSLAAHRWRLAGGMTGAFAILAAFSFLIAPRWPVEIIQQAQGYTSYTDIGSVSGLLADALLPQFGPWGEYALSAVLLAWLGWEWWRTGRAAGDAFQWAAAATLVVTLVISPRTGTTSQPMLFPILALLFARIDSSGRSAGRRAYVALVLLITLIGLWWLFLITVAGRVEQPPVYLPLPLGVAGALLLAGRLPASRTGATG